MASSYPGALDSFTNPTSTDDLDTPGVLHDEQHANANDAIEAVQGELGVSPSGDFPSVAGRLAHLQAGAGDALEVVVDPDGFTGSAPSAAQVVPTPGFPSGGQTTHPSVLFVPQGFAGYRYWMAHTPYQGGDDTYEDPCIVASNDGDSWEVPAGLTNPLDDQPGSPGAYNSDTDLMLGPDGLLHLFWRTREPASTGAEEKVYTRTSADGVTWTAKAVVLARPMATEVLASPTVVWDQGVWHLWTVDIVPSPNVVRHRTASSPTGTWSSADACTVPTPSGREPWHLAVRRLGGSWLGVLNDVPTGVTGGQGDLYLMTSSDGLAWDVSASRVVPQSASGLYDFPYRGCVVPTVREGVLGFDLWFGGYVTSGLVWNIFRTHLAPPSGATAGSYAGVNAQTGTSYTATVSDQGKLVTLDNASAISVTLPTDASAAIPVGGWVDFAALNTGMATLNGESGATVNTPTSKRTLRRYSTVRAVKRAANAWLLSGDLDPTATLSYSDTVLADSPEVFYRFAETSGTTAADASPNLRDGTIAGTPTLDVAGPVSKAITFDGTNDVVSRAYDAWLTNSAADSFTVECWFKTSTAGRAIMAKHGNNAGWNLLIGGGSQVLFTVFGKGYRLSAGTYTDNAWHHVVAVNNGSGGSVDVYIDGALDNGTTSTSAYSMNSSTALTIGSRNGGLYWVGSLAEPAYYSTALNATQVADHYAAATA